MVPILCALLVGALHGSADVRMRIELGPEYRGVPFMGAMDEGLYLSRMMRASLGDWRLGNAMIYEHRDDPWIYGPIGEVAQGRLVKWSGLPVADVDIVLTFVLPAVLTLVAYGLFLSLTKSVPFAALGAMSIVLGQYLLSKDTPLLQGSLVPAVWSLPLQFVRPISPQFYCIPFLIVVWAAFRLYDGGGGKWVWILGVAGTVQLYTNFFLTSFVVVGLGLLLTVAAVQRRLDVVTRFFGVAAIALVGGLPYFHNLWLTVTHPQYQESFARVGGFATREPILPVVHVIVALAFGGLAWTARRERWYQFTVAFLATGFICLNQQLLTGRTVQPFHWESQTNKVILEVALVLGTWHIMRRFGAPRGATVALCTISVAALLVHGWGIQNRYLDAKRAEFAALQRLGPPLQWLADHTDSTDVVLVNPLRFEWADIVTTVTGNYTYVSEPFFYASFLTRDEVERRYLGGLRFYGATPEEMAGFGRWLSGAHFLGMAGMPSQVPTADQRLVHAYLADLQRRYVQAQPGSAWDGVRDFKLDYVLLQADEIARVTPRVQPATIQQVYHDGQFVIWRVPQEWR
jgi:hypothetical protein